MSKVNLLVSVDDEHMERLSEVAEKVKDVGMDVEQELEEIGVITGSIDSEKVEPLRKVEGVSQVEESRRFHIAPPDRTIQ